MEKNQKIISDLGSELPPEFSSKEANAILAPYYRAPGKALEYMVECGRLLRLKKGLYTLPEQFDPIAAANAIHSPSYLSFETALSIHGLIPERVETIQSVADGRQVSFVSVGRRYIYRSQDRHLYAAGMASLQRSGRNVLVASREKAILDTLSWNKLQTARSSSDEIFEFVCDGLRIDYDALMSLSLRKLRHLRSLYRNRAPALLVTAIEGRRKTMGNRRRGIGTGRMNAVSARFVGDVLTRDKR